MEEWEALFRRSVIHKGEDESAVHFLKCYNRAEPIKVDTHIEITYNNTHLTNTAFIDFFFLSSLEDSFSSSVLIF